MLDLICVLGACPAFNGTVYVCTVGFALVAINNNFHANETLSFQPQNKDNNDNNDHHLINSAGTWAMHIMACLARTL